MNRFLEKIWIFSKDIKLEHSLFALPFAYLGLFMAEGKVPTLFLFVWITVAMVTFRTFAMCLNRLLDAPIDIKNPRTKNRALPSGKLTKPAVWTVAAVSLLIFELSAYKLKPLCFILTPVPIILAFIYPLMKRITWFSHFVLGSVLAIAPYGAWIASRGTFGVVPTLLSLGVVFWVAGFDMAYALQDVEFDRGEGLHSFPVAFGQDMTLALTQILHLLSVIFWVFAGFLNGRGTIFFGGVFLAALFLNRSYHMIRSADLAKIDKIFFVMNAIVSISVFGATVIDILWKGRVI